MAEKILRNEAYMDDACFSVFSNLHKAAKRKSNYIWSNSRYSLDSIWSDDAQPKTSKAPDDASSVRKSKVVCSSNKGRSKSSKMYSNLNKADKESSESEQTNKTDSDETGASLRTEQNGVVFRNDKGNDGEEVLSWKCQISLVFKTKNNVHTSSEVTSDNSYLQLKGEKKETEQKHHSRKDLERISAERKTVDCGRYLSEEKVPFPDSQELSSHISPKSAFSRMKNNDQAETYYSVDSKDLNNLSDGSNTNVPNKNILVSQSDQYTISQGSNFSSSEGISTKLRDTMIFDSVSESQKTYVKSKAKNTDIDQNEKTTLRTKRTRHSSGASTSSTMPAQKKSTFKTKNDNAQLSPNANNGLLKAMLCIKLIKGEQYFEIFVDASDFSRVKCKFPKLQEVLPDMNGEKEIKYCLEAVKVVFRSLFNPPFNCKTFPEGKIAMEVLAATKSWEVTELHKKFRRIALERISQDNFNATYPAAVHFGLTEICAAYKKILSVHHSPSDSAPYRQRNCFVSVSPYVEPEEFCIPLHAAAQSLHDQFPRDLNNEIIFEAVKGSYVIKGFHILLNTTGNSPDITKQLDVFYSIRNLDDEDEGEQMKITKPLRPNIVIHFRRKITVHQDQKAEIVIDTNISPYLCMAIETSSLTEKTEGKEFNLNFTSNFKVENSNEKRFFVKKLLYYPQNETS